MPPFRPKSRKGGKKTPRPEDPIRPARIQKPEDVIRQYPGGVAPGKKYAVRTKDEIVDHARLLYFVVDESLQPVYSLEKTARVLKRTYPIACNNISRMSVSNWVRRFGWENERSEAVQEAYREAKDAHERQEIYKKIVTGKFGLEIAELNALISKPASGRHLKDIPLELRENENALLKSTQNRLGLVLVELRGLNATSFNELTRRDKMTGELVYRPKNRKELLEEYALTTNLIIKLYGIHILQKMAGIDPRMFDPKLDNNSSSDQLKVPSVTDLTDAMLQQCSVSLPSELATAAMAMFNAKKKGAVDAGSATGTADNQDSDGAPDKSNDIVAASKMDSAKN